VANTQATFGFRQIGYTSGGAPDFQLATGVIASANGTKIFRGDPVIYNTGTGKIEQASSQLGAVRRCVRWLRLHACGRHPEWSPFWPAAGAVADATAYIINAPNALFIVAALNTSVVQANVGENVGFSIGTGNTSTGFSAATIDQSTLNTTNTLPFRVVAPCTTVGQLRDCRQRVRSDHAYRLGGCDVQQRRVQATDRLGVREH
jgi:hypothetical protein